MKAIIMAGGEGARLRPVTCGMPKPAVPVKDRPVILHIIDLLEKNGISDIAVTLRYMPGEIKNIIENAVSRGEISADVRFCTETSPLGTAGSVRNCIEVCFDGAREDFLIISGDAVTDINIREMEDFHRSRGKMATIAVKAVETPTEFGVVLVGKDSTVTGFIEKPEWREAVSNIVNTGIYIVTPELMELCPGEGECDFAKDIFSKVSDLSENIAAYCTDAFWCDIGDSESYLSVNMRYAPFTGENCAVSPEADVKGSVICHGACIGSGTAVSGSVIMQNVSVGQWCTVRDCIICPGAVIEDGTYAEGCVIGEKAHIGRSCRINKGAKIWNNVNILQESTVNGIIRESGSSASSYSPENILRIGRAFGTFLGRNASCLVCADRSGSGCMICAGMESALASTGIAVKTAEPVSLSVVRWICRQGVCDGAVYICDDGEIKIHFLNRFGDDLCKSERRKLRSVYNMEDFAPVRKSSVHPFENISSPEDYYISSLLDIFRCPHKNLNYIGRHFTRSQRIAAAAYLTVKMFPDAPVFLPASDSMAAGKIAEKYDRYTIRCGEKDGDIMSEMEKFMHINGVYAEYLMFFDDLAFDLGLCCIDGFISDEADSDAEELIRIPLYTSETKIDCGKANKSEIIRKFINTDIAKKGFELNDGVCIRSGSCSARVCACDDSSAFKIYVESMSEEYGKEISGEIVRTLQNLLT